MDVDAEKDELRALFKTRFPSVATIEVWQIHMLIAIIDKELKAHAENHLTMWMLPLDRFTLRMIRDKGIEYKGLEMLVGAHYFPSGRQAITITKDGRIGFCGWAGGNNPEPFIRGFRIWLESV